MDIISLIEKRQKQKEEVQTFLNKYRKQLLNLDLYFFFKELSLQRQLEFISKWKEIQDRYK